MPESSWQVNVLVSFAVNVNDAAPDADGFGGFEVIVVTGGVVSTVHVNDAAAPVLPAESLALTWNVCDVPVWFAPDRLE